MAADRTCGVAAKIAADMNVSRFRLECQSVQVGEKVEYARQRRYRLLTEGYRLRTLAQHQQLPWPCLSTLPSTLDSAGVYAAVWCLVHRRSSRINLLIQY